MAEAKRGGGKLASAVGGSTRVAQSARAGLQVNISCFLLGSHSDRKPLAGSIHETRGQDRVDAAACS